jgi:hypothetical protein
MFRISQKLDLDEVGESTVNDEGFFLREITDGRFLPCQKSQPLKKSHSIS